MLEVVKLPPDFKYMDAYLQGRPQHARFDRFSIRHPKMELGKRAKIFAPFDALRGFHFAITRKDVPYEEKPELSRETMQELNRRLSILRELTRTSRLARQNCVSVTVTYFQPCSDAQHEAYGRLGRQRTVTGICRSVDIELSMRLRIDDRWLSLEDILWVESDEPWFAVTAPAQ